MENSVKKTASNAPSVVGLILGICSTIVGIIADLYEIYMYIAVETINADNSGVAWQMVQGITRVTNPFGFAMIVIGIIFGVTSLILCKFGVNGKPKKIGQIFAIIGLVMSGIAFVLLCVRQY